MGKFIFAMIVGVAIFLGGAYLYAKLGFVDIRADQKPSGFENRLAGGAMDASTEKHAPRQKNPLPPTQETLLAGARLYRDDCAGCHGSPVNPASDFGSSFYPPVPQFFKDAPDMPEHQNFYIIKHGVRWTGMPAWGHIMTDSEIWQVVTMLSHLQKLPPEITEELRKPSAPK
jgi:thiosulfate dehydrogenase